MREIVILLVDRCQLLDFAGPYDVFTAANQSLMSRGVGKSNLYKIQLVGQTSTITVDGDQSVAIANATKYTQVERKIDTLLVVGSQKIELAIKPATVEWIKRASSKSRRTVAICTGSFLLAAAGLLDGRNAATHWMFCNRMARRFPQVEVDRTSIYVKDGKFYTSAGVTAGIDLALALVEEDHGAAVAYDVARGLVVYMRRPGGQNQFSAALTHQLSELGPFDELVPWVMNNLRKSLSVEVLADRCSMSTRNFARQFTIRFKMTPAKFIETLRLEAAKTLMNETNLSLEQISSKCGFNSPDALRRSFIRNFQLTPTDYRKMWQK